MSVENATAVVDPLTIQILRRTGTENTLRQKFRRESGDDSATRDRGESVGGIGERNPPDTITKNTETQPQGREKKSVFSTLPRASEIFLEADTTTRKGVSFLSRIMGGKKKVGDLPDDEDMAGGDVRTEGMDAHVFSQPIGYIAQFPAPPKYIRVSSSRAFSIILVLIDRLPGPFAQQTKT